MKKLTLFYDAKCGLCSQVRQWLQVQPAFVELAFLPYDSAEAERLLPGLRHLRADEEIVVMADTGEVWQGAGAWVTCLWALQDYRGWSLRLASPTMQGVAKQVVHWISRHRIGLSQLMRLKSDSELAAAAQAGGGEMSCEWRPPERRADGEGKIQLVGGGGVALAPAVGSGNPRWHDLDLID